MTIRKLINPDNLIAAFFMLSVFIMFCGILFNKINIEYNRYKNNNKPIIATTAPLWKADPRNLTTVPKTFFANFNGFLESTMPFHDRFIDFYGAFAKTIGKKVIDDANPGTYILKLNNGQLYFFNPKKKVNQEAQANISELQKFCVKNNTHFHLIVSPDKITELKDIQYNMPFPYKKEYEILLQSLKNQNIPLINLRNIIHTEFPDKNRLYYTIDHHWRIETTLFIYFFIQKYFSNEFPDYFTSDFTLTDFNNYSTTTISTSFIGSQGRRVGRFFATIDTFNLIVPKYTTNFDVEYYRYGKPVEYKKGNFTDAFINTTCFADGAPYDAYLSGNLPLVKIKNRLKPKGKLLVIKDSYAVPIVAFLASAVNEIHMVDLRYYRENDLHNIIAAEKYDFVWVMYNESSFGEEKELFNFL